jgi:catechol 2,3-dioxygenase-like lactoylglutathione lyase family enzyme
VISPAPPPTLGLRHVALRFADLDGAERFFVDLLGYEVEWRPDPDNVYLARREAGVARDNVALHRTAPPAGGRDRSDLLDHVGLVVPSAEDVDRWAAWLDGHGANVLARPRTHRDGARSLYLAGPEGLVVQIIHHPPIG